MTFAPPALLPRNWQKLLPMRAALSLALIFISLFTSGCSALMRLAIQQAAPTTPTPTRQLTIDPQIELSPASGYAGAYLNVQGDGWSPGQIILITMRDEQGDSNIVAASTVDADGRFAGGFLYPIAQRWLNPGDKTIVATSSDSTLTASATFAVEAPEGVTAVVTDAPATLVSPTQTPTTTVGTILTATVAAPTITPTVTVTDTQAIISGTQRPRPFENGVFLAPLSTGVNLDADLSLWSNAWIPVQTLVFGQGNYAGAADLSGEFQALWSADGLYLAIRVRDDAYRAGPPGSELWQGDGIEIHFDRQLNTDYDEAEMSSDDYQIGISFGLQLNDISSYRWFPENQQGPILVAGAVRPTNEGYEAELLIPWTTFDVQPSEVVQDATFGFNLSLNDNDGAAPAQETILSASTARLDYRRPPEWGTLILRGE